jgi:hypothetical protein
LLVFIYEVGVEFFGAVLDGFESCVYGIIGNISKLLECSCMLLGGVAELFSGLAGPATIMWRRH